MLRFSLHPAIGAAAVAAALSAAGAQQSNISLSPFVTFLPTGSASPMTGLALAFTGGPLAIRAGGHLALKERAFTTTSTSTNSSTTTGPSTTTTSSITTTRPWGADADAIAYLESFTYGDRVAFMPYVFTGVSTTAEDSGSAHVNRQGWSYGGGLTIPVGSALGLFGEARWRMSRYVMPNAPDAPSPKRELRVGISFRVGGSAGLGDLVRVISPGSEDALNLDGSTGSLGAARVLSTADGYVGTPYRRGGTSPSSGFDASGFVRFIFSRFGVNLPRMSRDQARVGERVRTDWRVIAPGDLLLFEDEGGINHVAIYVGKSRIIHSSASGGGVRYDDLSSERGRWFIEHLVAARRVTPDLRGLLLDLARGYPGDVRDNADGPDHAPRAPMRKRN